CPPYHCYARSAWRTNLEQHDRHRQRVVPGDLGAAGTGTWPTGVGRVRGAAVRAVGVLDTGGALPGVRRVHGESVSMPASAPAGPVDERATDRPQPVDNCWG